MITVRPVYDAPRRSLRSHLFGVFVDGVKYEDYENLLAAFEATLLALNNSGRWSDLREAGNPPETALRETR